MKKTRQLFRAGTALLALLLLFSVAPLPAAAADELSPYTLEDFHPAALTTRQYDNIGEFVDGVAFYQVGGDLYGSSGKYGLIGADGKEITAPIFEQEQLDSRLPGGFSHGLSPIKKIDSDYNELCGYINKKGEFAIPYQYAYAGDFSEGLANVGLPNGKSGFIDVKGKTVLPFIYDETSAFHEGLAAVCKNEKWGYINRAGKVVIPFQYSCADDFFGGYAEAKRSTENGARNDTIVDKNGKVIAEVEQGETDKIWDLYCDLTAPAREAQLEYTMSGEGDTYYLHYADYSIRYRVESPDFYPRYLDHVYLDTNGQPLNSSVYKKGEPFSCGFALVDGGLIDKQGGTVAGVSGIRRSFNADGHAVMWKDEKPAYILTSPLAPVKVAPAASKVLVDGKQVAFDAYAIHGNNYFKLRDIAQILNGTGKQFNVTWNKEKSAIDMQSGTAYLPVGGELTPGGGGAKTARRSSAPIYLNGAPVSLAIYDIGGNNYFKLRDLGQTFDFQVAWDSAAKAVVIDTALHYTAPVA